MIHNFVKVVIDSGSGFSSEPRISSNSPFLTVREKLSFQIKENDFSSISVDEGLASVMDI